jgi:hypothetical protein
VDSKKWCTENSLKNYVTQPKESFTIKETQHWLVKVTWILHNFDKISFLHAYTSMFIQIFETRILLQAFEHN